MGNRLLVKVVEEGHCIGWFYQKWMADDSAEFRKCYIDALRGLGLDRAVTCEQAVRALARAGESIYGRGAYRIDTPETVSGQYTRVGVPVTDLGHVYAPNAMLLAEHPDLAGDPTVDTYFFVGTGDEYPDYMAGWCEWESTLDGAGNYA